MLGPELLEDVLSNLQEAIRINDFEYALDLGRAAYEIADTDERAVLLPYLGPNTATQPLD